MQWETSQAQTMISPVPTSKTGLSSDIEKSSISYVGIQRQLILPLHGPTQTAPLSGFLLNSHLISAPNSLNRQLHVSHLSFAGIRCRDRLMIARLFVSPLQNQCCFDRATWQVRELTLKHLSRPVDGTEGILLNRSWVKQLDLTIFPVFMQKTLVI